MADYIEKYAARCEALAEFHNLAKVTDSRDVEQAISRFDEAMQSLPELNNSPDLTSWRLDSTLYRFQDSQLVLYPVRFYSRTADSVMLMTLEALGLVKFLKSLPPSAVIVSEGVSFEEQFTTSSDVRLGNGCTWFLASDLVKGKLVVGDLCTIGSLKYTPEARTVAVGCGVFVDKGASLSITRGSTVENVEVVDNAKVELSETQAGGVTFYGHTTAHGCSLGAGVVGSDEGKVTLRNANIRDFHIIGNSSVVNTEGENFGVSGNSKLAYVKSLRLSRTLVEDSYLISSTIRGKVSLINSSMTGVDVHVGHVVSLANDSHLVGVDPEARVAVNFEVSLAGGARFLLQYGEFTLPSVRVAAGNWLLKRSGRNLQVVNMDNPAGAYAELSAAERSGLLRVKAYLESMKSQVMTTVSKLKRRIIQNEDDNES